MIAVTVVHSPKARELLEFALQLPEGASVADALLACGLTQLPGMTLGVWNLRALPGQLLRQQDRVELYRPLGVDPKLARRARFARQGKRATGLFAHKSGGTS